MTDKLCEIGYIRKEYYGQIAMTDSGVKAANSFFTSYILPFPNGESLTDFKKRCVAAFDKAIQKYKDKNAICINDRKIYNFQKSK